ILLSAFDFFHHFPGGIGQNTVDDLIVANGFKLLPIDEKVVRDSRFSYRGCMAEHLDAEILEQYLRQAARGHASSGFACARALEDVSRIRMIVFERPCEI